MLDMIEYDTPDEAARAAKRSRAPEWQVVRRGCGFSFETPDKETVKPTKGQMQYTKKTLEKWTLDELTMMRGVKGRVVKKVQVGRDWVEKVTEATDPQWIYFCHKAAVYGLDPMRNQMHWTPNADITGIDGFRSIADRTGRYVPGRIEIEQVDGHVVAAHATIKIQSKDGLWHELTETAYTSEYLPVKSDGTTSNPIWKKMPAVMIKKCAEAIALRRAFPDQLAGIYTDDEMAQASSEPQQAKAPEPKPASEQRATPEQVKLARDLYADIESGAQVDSEVMALLTPKLQAAMMALLESKAGAALSVDKLLLVENLHKSFGGAK